MYLKMNKMRNINHKSTLNFYLILCGMTLLTVTSCVFTNNKKEESIFSNIAKNKKEYKNTEAELLSKFNKQNIELISISHKAREKEVPFRIKCLATDLIHEQKDINISINKIASKKLIIIPNVSNEKRLKEIEKASGNSFNRKYLENVSKILTSQIDNLRLLTDTTKDVDFKILALQTIVKLNSSLQKVKRIKSIQT
ncbi:DUF4142 domain-containing protein [Flavobacterium jumunjinense]